MFATNIGSLDKGLRIIFGIVLLGLGAFGPIGWWGLIGVVPLVTGIFGTCPLYSILGINTCPSGVGKA
jgi:hypothetical protein